MPYIKIPVRRQRTFVPAQAGQIAARWRGISKDIRKIAQGLRSIQDSLNGTWEGNSKQRFMSEYGALPGNVDGCADLLDSLASRVESITVTEWETVMKKVWRSEDVGA